MPILVCSQCGGNSFDSLNHGFRCQFCGTVIAWEVVIHKHEGEVTAKQPDFIIRAGKLEKYTGAATEVVIPDNVTIIGEKAFEKCSGLKHITIPNSITTIESSAFYGCSGLTNITLPDSVTSIGPSAFEGCSNLTSITIPNGIKTIAYSTFFLCYDLKHVTIPESVTFVDQNAFAECNNSIEFVYPPNINLKFIHDVVLKNYINKKNQEIEQAQKAIEQERRALRISRMSKNLCLHCGGPIKGFRSPKCTLCGRERDY